MLQKSLVFSCSGQSSCAADIRKQVCVMRKAEEQKHASAMFNSLHGQWVCTGNTPLFTLSHCLDHSLFLYALKRHYNGNTRS